MYLALRDRDFENICTFCAEEAIYHMITDDLLYFACEKHKDQLPEPELIQKD